VKITRTTKEKNQGTDATVHLNVRAAARSPVDGKREFLENRDAAMKSANEHRRIDTNLRKDLDVRTGHHRSRRRHSM